MNTQGCVTQSYVTQPCVKKVTQSCVFYKKNLYLPYK